MNRRYLAAALSLVVLGSGARAADLVVAAGQTLTVTPAQATLQLDRLTLGDDAVVRFAPGVAQWRVDARRVTIGHNVTIDGSGAAGAAGSAGSGARAAAPACEAGQPGGAGGAGAAGGAGVALQLRLGIAQLGSLQVASDGGAGGPGGAGGAGQDGGPRSGKCPTPDGGRGGAGGTGGPGGNGGAVQISYYALDGEDGFQLRDRIAVTAEGGAGGAGAEPGKGGAAQPGGAARTTNPIATNPRIPGGKPGAPGAAGAGGERGRAGPVAVQEIAALTAPPAPISAPAAAGGGDEVEQLRREMERLARDFERVKGRLQELEQR